MPGFRRLIMRTDPPCDLPGGNQYSQRNGQIKSAGSLGVVCRCKINGNAGSRKFKTAAADSRTHPFTTFPNTGIGQPDNIKCRQPGPDMYLNTNGLGIKSQQVTAI